MLEHLTTLPSVVFKTEGGGGGISRPVSTDFIVPSHSRVLQSRGISHRSGVIKISSPRTQLLLLLLYSQL